MRERQRGGEPDRQEGKTERGRTSQSVRERQTEGEKKTDSGRDTQTVRERQTERGRDRHSEMIGVGVRDRQTVRERQKETGKDRQGRERETDGRDTHRDALCRLIDSVGGGGGAEDVVGGGVGVRGGSRVR